MLNLSAGCEATLWPLLHCVTGSRFAAATRQSANCVQAAY